MFCCSICDHAFSSSSKLNLHKQIHKETSSKSTCDICNYKLDSSTSMRNHRYDYHSWRATKTANLKITIKRRTYPFKCPTCFHPFHGKAQLSRHLNSMANPPWKCWTCNKIFGALIALNRHMLTHRPGQCRDLKYLLREFNLKHNNDQ